MIIGRCTCGLTALSRHGRCYILSRRETANTISTLELLNDNNNNCDSDRRPPNANTRDRLLGKIASVPQNLAEYTPDKIRNFCIVAHVDHGKSTLADRLLEMTGTISHHDHNEQVLDKLQVERERGITVKAQTASMFYSPCGSRSSGDLCQSYLLNLIDTPGHVDFHFEVSRSIVACDGVILLVDASQGVQAQTVANFFLAFERDLTIIPVLNKVDLANAEPEKVADQIFSMFEIPQEECIRVSAKSGLGVKELLLPALVDRLPAPQSDIAAPLRAFVFDSWYEKFRGVQAGVLVKDGSIRRGQAIQSLGTGRTFEVQEVGIMYPNAIPVDCLFAGQMGYISANVQNVADIPTGDTICLRVEASRVQALPGFQITKPMVFAGVFPIEGCQYESLRASVEQLALNDPALTLEQESNPALGNGWRVGFLGLLHMEVFYQRLDQEYDASVILTTPSVPFRAHLKDSPSIRKKYGRQSVVTIVDPSKFPSSPDVEYYEEPCVSATIICPEFVLGKVMKLCDQRRGVQKSTKLLDKDRLVLEYTMPMVEVILDFHDELKLATSGYGSFDYEPSGYWTTKLVKLDIALNKKVVPEFSVIVPQESARLRGRDLVDRLVEEIPRQWFEIAVQAKIGAKVVARGDIRAYRKSITAKLHASDASRKKKLQANQNEGKKRMRMVNDIEVPKETFLNILKRRRNV